ncbi:uncharacterized protein TRIVIDRAFT_217587 [Trichoderma virens Gv29-8]|uniref:Uncharacterized protein n=1 Tax=Hypocrea virens (strain Gv29-8 / FGSC 10586) TaxID=413071 RepID=G9MF14_HYPVG|nr:uncharacterized protein TRIVIDRAFT_217587 [Trichoderma virens Gv29-8]EHK26980.1 hypothetical protein TRIVIDRAFT_217587 [Trichoderma virens Gv29-8]UKZ57433.1 hypothetical protein TrVGV298_011290 [Trichoderma virens]
MLYDRIQVKCYISEVSAELEFLILKFAKYFFIHDEHSLPWFYVVSNFENANLYAIQEEHSPPPLYSFSPKKTMQSEIDQLKAVVADLRQQIQQLQQQTQHQQRQIQQIVHQQNAAAAAMTTATTAVAVSSSSSSSYTTAATNTSWLAVISLLVFFFSTPSLHVVFQSHGATSLNTLGGF